MNYFDLSTRIVRTCSFRILLAGLMATGMLSPALAQSDPRPLQIVVPYAPGNGLDLLARKLAETMHEPGHRSIIVVNRGGAGGVIGTVSVVNAQPDGRTVLMHAHPPYGTSPLFQKPAPYDPRTSLLPVARVGTVPMVLVTSSRSPISTFEQMKQFIAANPGKANYASSGVGSPGQIYTEMLKSVTGLAIKEIPYTNPSQALVDVISGEILLSMASMPAAKPHLQSGALRLLAVGSPKRVAGFPQVPTMAEVSGKADFEAGISYAMFAPAGTSAEQVHQLYADVAKAYAKPGVRAWMEQNDVSGSLQAPPEFATWLNADLARMAKLAEPAKQATTDSTK